MSEETESRSPGVLQEYGGTCTSSDATPTQQSSCVTGQSIAAAEALIQLHGDTLTPIYKYPCLEFINGNCQNSVCKLSHDKIFLNLNKIQRRMVICKDYIFKKRCDRICHYIHCSEDEAEYYWKNAQFEDSHFEKILVQNYNLISHIVDHTYYYLEFDNTEIIVNGKLSLTVENKRAIEALIIICHAQCKYVGFRTQLTDAILKSVKAAAGAENQSNNYITTLVDGSKVQSNLVDNNLYGFVNAQHVGNRSKEGETVWNDNGQMTRELITSKMMISQKLPEIQMDSLLIKKHYDPNINTYADPNKRNSSNLYYRPFENQNNNKKWDADRRKSCYANVEDLPGSSFARKIPYAGSLINMREKVPRLDNCFGLSSSDLETDETSKLSSSKNNKACLQNELEMSKAQCMPLIMSKEQEDMVRSKRVNMFIKHGLVLNEVEAFKLLIQDELGNEVRKLLYKVVNQYDNHTTREIAVESIKECFVKRLYTE